MAVGRSVQFRGVDKVLQAYENMAVAPWALFQGTQLLAKSEADDLEGGKALLNQLLLNLNDEDNVATYTLCVYDDLAAGEKIKNNSKYDGSFNFKLNDTMQDYKSQRSAGIGQISADLSEIKARLSAIESPIENEQEEKGAWATIGKLLEHPQVQQALAGKLVTILDGVTNGITGIFQPKKPFLSPSAIGAVGETLSPEQVAKVNEAIRLLSSVDPLLGDHLLGIAEIAVTDPSKYKMLTGMLKSL